MRITSFPITEPSWCTNGARCRGDHVGLGVKVPATGSDGVRASVGSAQYPAIVASPAHTLSEGGSPTVQVQMVGGDWDVVASLRSEEARRLVAALESALEAHAHG